MAAPSYADAQTRFGDYALEFVDLKVKRIGLDQLERYRAIPRAADAFVAEVAAAPPQSGDAHALRLVETVHSLQSAVVQELASVGIGAG